MLMLVPLGTGIVVFWPCMLEAVNVVSSALSFGTPVTYERYSILSIKIDVRLAHAYRREHPESFIENTIGDG
jgi:hypothetical protein